MRTRPIRFAFRPWWDYWWVLFSLYNIHIRIHACRIRCTLPKFRRRDRPFRNCCILSHSASLVFSNIQMKHGKGGKKKCENTKICERYEKVEIKIVTSYRKFLNVLFETISIVSTLSRAFYSNVNKSSRLKYRRVRWNNNIAGRFSRRWFTFQNWISVLINVISPLGARQTDESRHSADVAHCSCTVVYLDSQESQDFPSSLETFILRLRYDEMT